MFGNYTSLKKLEILKLDIVFFFFVEIVES